MPWTPEAMAAVHAAVAGGEPARVVAERLGISRNAVLGVVYRYRRAKDLPVVKRAAAPKPPKPPVPPKPPSPPAYVAPKPSGISLRDGVRLRAAIMCDVETLSGPCGRPACVDGRCLGHRWMTLSPGERLRPPPTRIASTMAVEEAVERVLPIIVDKCGRQRVPGRWRNEMELARRAAPLGWQRLGDGLWMRRAA